MRYRSLFAVPAMVLALSTGAAFAASIGEIKSIGAAASEAEALVHKTHGCHRSCELGPAGWHRHAGHYCVRVACVPQAKQPFRCWVDRWGVRRCLW
jgi:hypothetical protein